MVPEVLRRSGGHMTFKPSHASSASHSPLATRHGVPASAMAPGQALLRPSQLALRSHPWPATPQLTLVSVTMVSVQVGLTPSQ